MPLPAPFLAIVVGVALLALSVPFLRRGWRARIAWGLVATLGLSAGIAWCAVRGPASDLSVQGTMPRVDVGGTWINSPPLSRKDLSGKVVLVDFWTYSCINCLRSLPYIKAWNDKYGRDGLVVIGVHAPEFAFEKDLANVRRAVTRFGVTWPVVTDNDYAIWNAFDNHYWPAHYLIDAKGRIRDSHFGEGDYDGTERAIQQLLAEAHPGKAYGGIVVAPGSAEMAAASAMIGSPETYIGYDRAENAVTQPRVVPSRAQDYTAHPVDRNEWGLYGNWTVGPQQAIANRPGAQVFFRFHARDLHLVLGLPPGARPIHFRVTLDGHDPGENHGVDVDAAGGGTVDSHRLYNLIRLKNPGVDHDFAIQFDAPGVEAYSFTFG
jgi:thiol-disulfide isomerase/thioredoxin